MAKKTTETKMVTNGNISYDNTHEEMELRAVEKIAGMEETDPEVTGYVEYTQKVFSNVLVVPMFDLHIGGEGCKLERLKKIIDFVKKTPNAVVVLGGDVLDNATLLGATNAHTSKVNPDRALDLAQALLAPIKDRILCVLAGNHDGTSGARNKDSNMAGAKQLALRLGVKYFPYNVLIELKLKSKIKRKNQTISFKVFATHGSGGASNKASGVDLALTKAMTACSKLSLIPDMILTGHFHSNANGVYDFIVPKYEDGVMVGEIQKSVRVESLSSMQEANSYAAANNMDMEVSNLYGINIRWTKNPYYTEVERDNEYEYHPQITKFPILKRSQAEYTRIASMYMKAFPNKEEIAKQVKEKFAEQTEDEILNEVNNLQ